MADSLTSKPGKNAWEHGVATLENNVVQTLSSQGLLSADNRRATRIPLNVQANFRVTETTDKWSLAQTSNMSQVGVRLISDDLSLKTGQEIDLELELPDTGKNFQMRGRIVWTRSLNPPGGKSQLEFGVAFENIKRISGKEKIFHFFAERLCQLSIKDPGGVEVRPAMTLDEVKAGYHLLYAEYMRRGYCEPNALEMHYNYFSFLPETEIFVLIMNGELIGTVSLFLDSPCGLPMESIFKEEVAPIRQPGRKLAEVGALAICGDRFGRKVFSLTHFAKQKALFNLFKVVQNYSQFLLGVTDILIAVHPRHTDLYSYLVFESVGPVRTYSDGKAALPMWHNIQKYQEKTANTNLNRFTYGEPRKLDLHDQRYRWKEEVVREFLIEKRDLWSKIPPQSQAYLQSFYPSLKNL